LTVITRCIIILKRLYPSNQRSSRKCFR
jgi:hypothetical protein